MREDVQALLRKVTVRPDKEFTKLYPKEMPARITVHLTDGRALAHEVRDYPGFRSRPFSWDGSVSPSSSASPRRTRRAAKHRSRSFRPDMNSLEESSPWRTLTRITAASDRPHD